VADSSGIGVAVPEVSGIVSNRAMRSNAPLTLVAIRGGAWRRPRWGSASGTCANRDAPASRWSATWRGWRKCQTPRAPQRRPTGIGGAGGVWHRLESRHVLESAVHAGRDSRRCLTPAPLRIGVRHLRHPRWAGVSMVGDLARMAQVPDTSGAATPA